MPIYQEPVERKETYTLSGNGSITLTEEQRRSRLLTVLIEKVKKGNPVEYYNFRFPEPRTYWGQVQFVYRDYIAETHTLEFRRQVIKAFNDVQGENAALQTCLILASQRLAYERLLDLLSIGGVTQQDREILGLEWKTVVPTPKLVSKIGETALWYEIGAEYVAKVTMIWRPYAEECDELSPLKLIAGGRGTDKDEERPAPGGGGAQPSNPPPPGRTADPDADSPSPPPNNGSSPPSPTERPPLANTRITVTYGKFAAGTPGQCTPNLTAVKSHTVPGVHPRSDFQLIDESPGTNQAPACPNLNGFYKVGFSFKGVRIPSLDGGPVEYSEFPSFVIDYV